MEFEDKTQVFDASKLKAAAGAKAEARAACLIVIAGSQTGRMFKLEGQAASVIGRATDAPIRIEDEGVSRHHAKVQTGFDGRVYVEDMGSTNGTFLNGSRVGREPLGDGDKLQLGTATILKFSFQDSVDEDFARRQYEMATRDALTGCNNKKYFFERLGSEFSFAFRHKNPICLVMFDIDHFKKVNDTYGHPAGDVILRAVGQLLLTMTRRSDVVARYGGEEFIALMREVKISDALMVCERIRQAIERQAHVVGNDTLQITISIGLCELTEKSGIRTAEEFIKATDNLLYKAKHGGRNRTECDLL